MNAGEEGDEVDQPAPVDLHGPDPGAEQDHCPEDAEYRGRDYLPCHCKAEEQNACIVALLGWCTALMQVSRSLGSMG
jgi:hypothetical protein